MSILAVNMVISYSLLINSSQNFPAETWLDGNSTP